MSRTKWRQVAQVTGVGLVVGSDIGGSVHVLAGVGEGAGDDGWVGGGGVDDDAAVGVGLASADGG